MKNIIEQIPDFIIGSMAACYAITAIDSLLLGEEIILLKFCGYKISLKPNKKSN